MSRSIQKLTFWIGILVVLLVGAPRGGSAQVPRDSVPVVLSVSGGISLGAYEAGVNWSIVEFLRASQDPAFREAIGARDGYYLAAATGASAGNVNGLLSALEWCADRAREPEESLFWTMWVQTGIEQLMNKRLNDSANEAVFHRDFLQDSVFGASLARMRSGTSRPCDVPVGLALTRVRPDSVPIDAGNQIWGRTQRFVAAYRVRNEGTRLVFDQPHPALHSDQSTGKLVVGTLDSAAAQVDSQWIMDAVSASGAFPVAFAPITLTYLDRDSLDANYKNGGTCEVRELFIDGGAFDINPLDLAISLRMSLPGRMRPDSGTRIVYIDPALLRNPILPLRPSPSGKQLAPRGISSLLDFVGPFITSSRSYEMHSLSRSLSRLGEVGEMQRHWLRATTRSQPIFGEHLGAFAAFLGRPMREYDFFAGIYDGLHFAAHDLVCNRSRDTACVQGALERLILSGRLPLGEIAPRAVHHFYADEYGRPLPLSDGPRIVMDREDPPVGPERLTKTRAFLQDRLLRAHHEVLLTQVWTDSIQCKNLHWQQGLTCSGGFGAVLDRTATREVMDEIELWTDEPYCAWDMETAAPSICPVEGHFQRLLANREEFTLRLTDRVMHQVWRIEDRLGWDPDTERWSKEELVEWAELAYRGLGPRRAATFGLRHGWELDPSSIQTVSTHSWKPYVQALPFNLSMADGNGVEFGYRPTLNPSPKTRFLSIVFPGAFTWRSGGRYEVSAGAGLRWNTGWGWVPGVELAYQPVHSTDPGDNATLNSWQTGTVAATLLADRLRVSVRYIGDPEPDVLGGRRWWYTIGLSDFNGLIYWWSRTRG
jgi:hypothetical protein